MPATIVAELINPVNKGAIESMLVKNPLEEKLNDNAIPQKIARVT